MILYCPRCGSEFPAKFRGEWFDSGPICGDCGVSLGDPPAMLAPSEAEMTYGLDEWPVADRAAVTAALFDDDVPYRWEAGVVLVVPDAVEALVDGILDDLEGSGPAPDLWDDGEAADPDADLDTDADEADEVDEADEADEVEDAKEAEEADGGAEAQAAMSDLFVVADRLQHAPWDPDLIAELETLTAAVGSSLPPYGVDRPTWSRIHDLAAAVGEASDDETASETIAALRDFLRPLV
jgi:hypothetical protein